jgi:DNA-binding transcriptional ArsR family regulator
MALNTVAALTSLAHEHRLAIYRALVQAGHEGLSAGAISEAVDIPPSSVSFHMKELTRADMVTSRSEGRFVIYTANFETINALVIFLTENCCGGQDCLPALCKPAKKSTARRKTA